MLGKLIKHDLKALSRYLILLHVFTIIFSIIGKFFVSGDIDWSNPPVITILYLVMEVLLLSALSIATYVIIAIHFYRNLYATQGYLTQTLPCTTGQLLLSKMISGFIWCLINLIVICGCSALFLLAFPSSWSEIAYAFSTELGINIWGFLLMAAGVSVIGCISSVLMIYMSIAIGQLFTSHRVLAAVITYGGLYMILQFLLSMLMLILPGGVMTFIQGLETATVSAMPSLFGDYLNHTMLVAVLMSAIQSIIYYCVTYYVMKRKTNLL